MVCPQKTYLIIQMENGWLIEQTTCCNREIWRYVEMRLFQIQ